MNTTFHYYVAYYICKQAGFSDKDSEIIAYSCAYVDHCYFPYNIKTKKDSFKSANTTFYLNESKDEAKLQATLLSYHFFPGDYNYEGARRKDKKMNWTNTTPNSEPVKELFIEALKSKNLYRIGIALHTFMDSYAHQNFSGMLNKWNELDNGIKFFKPRGHSQILWIPDDYFAPLWIDDRLEDDINVISNKTRFQKAMTQSYKFLCIYNKLNYNKSDIVWWELEDLLLTCSSKDEDEEKNIGQIINSSIINKIKEKVSYYPDSQLEKNNKIIEKLTLKYKINHFDNTKWEKEAFAYDENIENKLLKNINHNLRRFIPTINFIECRAKENFYDSDFYKWSISAVEHKNEAAKIIRNISINMHN